MTTDLSTLALESSESTGLRKHFVQIAEAHPCFKHPLFETLEKSELADIQLARLLRNYDAHASVLRRLLLKTASIMPEEAVGFVLENVRNEYGNGDYRKNHQGQLRDLAWSCGISPELFFSSKIQDGVKFFIKEASVYYNPSRKIAKKLRAAAVAAGAITATELLAVKEFACLQKTFISRKLQHHIWFHHLSVELEHCDDSLALALYFAESQDCLASVEYGLKMILDANIKLYDGLLSAIFQND